MSIELVGSIYLFSSRHLERPYAAFLAERADDTSTVVGAGPPLAIGAAMARQGLS